MPIPPHQRTTIVTKLSDLREQPSNQQIFQTYTLRQSQEQTPTYTKFLIATFFQTPEQRCFVTNRFYVDSAIQTNLAHQIQSSIPNSVSQFYHPIFTKSEYKIAGWENHPSRSISNINNAGAITFMFYEISSFF